MGNTRAWRACRSQQHHRARDVPLLSRMLAIPAAPRFEPALQPLAVLHERRHSGRVHSTGTAIVHGWFTTRARIDDLAIGGLSLLVDDATTMPEVGAHVRIELRLDGLGRWLNLIGSVARVDTRRHGAALVIELRVVPPDFEDLVQDELLTALERAHVPQGLFVDRAHEEQVGTV
jgi:hypothetical protein